VGIPRPLTGPGPLDEPPAKVTATTFPSAVMPPSTRGISAVFGEPSVAVIALAALVRYTSPLG